MANIKMSPSIRREVDRQKMMQTINEGNNFVFHYTIFRRRHPTPEEADEKWRNEIRQLKEILLEYQAAIESTADQPPKDS